MTLPTLLVVNTINVLLDSVAVLDQRSLQDTMTFTPEASHQQLDEIVSSEIHPTEDDMIDMGPVESRTSSGRGTDNNINLTCLEVLIDLPAFLVRNVGVDELRSHPKALGQFK